MKAELIPADGGPPIPITRDVTVVGRREFCDIHLDDPSLSKRHCVLVKTDGLLIIRDLATTNGTKVKGQKIRWAALLPEDKIAFGAVKFKIYLGPDDVLAPSELIARGIPYPPTKPDNGKPSAPARPAMKPKPVPKAAPKPAPRAAPAPARKPVNQPPVHHEGPGWAEEIDSDFEFDEDEVIDLD